MRRRSRAGGEPAKVQRRKTVARKSGVTSKAADPKSSSAAREETKVTRLTRELNEAFQQQTATSEVLKVISSSPGELKPVFQAILENAVRICDAKFGLLFLSEGDAFRAVALHDAPPAYAEVRRREPVTRFGPGTATDRAARTKQPVQIADVKAESAYLNDPQRFAFVDLAGGRTVVAVPMLKENELVGVIGIYRQEVRPFTDKQIELVKNFAAQAVIAIENARLLNELRQRTTDLTERTADLTEALEQQTAIGEILRVISNSPSDVQPVLDSVAEHAARICEAQVVDIAIVDNEVFRMAASFGEFGRLSIGEPVPLDRSSVTGRSICDLQPVQVADMKNASDEFPLGREFAIRFGHRTTLSVPLIREGRALGAILVRRTEVRPFEQKHIALLTTFADQSAIAIENVRLFEAEQQRTHELTESLEQQTASSEVLQVISSSPGDLQPVFETMLQNAVRICDAKFGNIFRWDGDALHLVATHNIPPAFAELRRRSPFRPGPENHIGRMVATKAVVHVADLAADQRYIERRDPAAVAAVELGGIRTFVAVPMLKENELIGALIVYRQEVRPFTDKQIELVTNFAAQAVIAIENARLLTELRQRTDELSESLEQQIATSDILSVISGSPGQLEPVFQTILANATRICEANFGILNLFDGNTFHNRATHGIAPEYMDFLKRKPPRRADPRDALGRLLETREPIHVADLTLERAYLEREPTRVEVVEIGGARTLLAVPMIKETRVTGAIVIYRKEVRPFTDKQIDLVKNFAAQAVIGVENARLLGRAAPAHR